MYKYGVAIIVYHIHFINNWVTVLGIAIDYPMALLFLIVMLQKVSPTCGDYIHTG